MKTSNISTEISSRIEDLVTQYYGFGKAGVDGILGLAETICQANDEFGQKYLAIFYERIKLDPKGSTCRKLMKIGSRRVRFEPVRDKLPNSWTTLYELARLEDDKFRQVVDDDVLHPLVTWQTIQDRFARSSGVDVEAPKRLTLDFSKVGPGCRGDFAKKLKALLDEFEVALGESQVTTLEGFLSVPNGTNKLKEGTNATASL